MAKLQASLDSILTTVPWNPQHDYDAGKLLEDCVREKGGFKQGILNMSGKYMLLFASLIFTTFLETGCGPVQFKDVDGGSGTTEDGNCFSFHTYKSQDEVTLLTYIEIFPSPELTRKALDKKVAEASSIIARGPRLDRNGKPIGERVVLTVESKAKGETQSESFICWTTNSRLHWIQCKSLKHALAFEKTLYP